VLLHNVVQFLSTEFSDFTLNYIQAARYAETYQKTYFPSHAMKLDYCHLSKFVVNILNDVLTVC